MKNVNGRANLFLLLLIFGVLVNQKTEAAPLRTTYQAKIIKPDGLPLQETAVNFRFTILDPTATCILYIEDYAAINMNDSGGVISFSLGAGTRSFPSSGTAATFSQVFDNSTAAYSCQTAGTYNPLSTDIRRIVMQFQDSSGWQSLPAMTINAVPYAWYAGQSDNAKTLNGKADSAFVQQTAIPTCSAGQALHFNGATFNCVGVVSSVTSTTVVTALGYAPADGVSLTALSSSVASTAATLTANLASVSSSVNAVSTSLTNLSNAVAASFTALPANPWTTSGSTIYYSTGSVAIGTVSAGYQLTVSGAISLNSNGFYLRGVNSVGTNGRLTGLTTANVLRVGDIDNIASQTSFAGNANENYITMVDDNGMRFGTSFTERMRITSEGAVGIGISNPSFPFEVKASNFGGQVGAQFYTYGAYSGVSLKTENIAGVFKKRSWTITNMNDFGGRTGLEFTEYVDNNGDDQLCDPGETCMPRMTIVSGGAVGIGTLNPSYKLDVSGTIRGWGITDSSDIRLKNTIQPLNLSLEKILKIQGVSYYWNDKTMPKKQIGFIAQQLEKIYPELVETDKEGFKSVNYSHLIAPVIEGLKTIFSRVTRNERKISSIDSQVVQLQSENNQLKQENLAIKSYLCDKDPQAPICEK